MEEPSVEGESSGVDSTGLVLIDEKHALVSYHVQATATPTDTSI